MAKIFVTDTHADGIFSVIRRGPSSNEPDINVGDPEFAALIARAVNNHDQLLAALVGLMDRIDEHEPDEWTAEDRIRNDAARAAIAAATT